MGDKVSYTDYGRSGVIYKDPSGKQISKDEWLEKADKQEKKNIMPKPKPKEMREAARKEVMSALEKSSQDFINTSKSKSFNDDGETDE